MKLSEYLSERGLAAEAYGPIVGVSGQTIRRILSGKGCNAETALAIVRESRGMVRLEDLVGEPIPAGNGVGGAA